MSSKKECLETTPLVTLVGGKIGEGGGFNAYVSNPDGTIFPAQVVHQKGADHKLEQCPQTGAHHLVPCGKRTPGKPALYNSQAFHDNYDEVFKKPYAQA